MVAKKEKKENPYKEGKMKDIGVRVGYTILWGRVSKAVRAGVQLCYYPAAPPYILFDGGALRDSRSAGPMHGDGYP